MPLFPQHWRSPFATSGAGEKAPPVAIEPPDPAADEAMIRFEPDAVVRAVVFHLLDEELARSVTDDSIRLTVSRLERKKVRLTIPRAKWRSMTHPERLDWLLLESGMVPEKQADGNVIVLGTRD